MCYVRPAKNLFQSQTGFDVLIPLYPEKCSKMPQNPQRPVHALLGTVYL